jgi:hypothetical protein
MAAKILITYRAVVNFVELEEEKRRSVGDFS